MKNKIGWGSLSIVLLAAFLIGNIVNMDRAPLIFNAVKQQSVVNLLNLVLLISAVVLVWKFPNDKFVKIARYVLVAMLVLVLVLNVLILFAEIVK